jgi:hypothetical protein
MISNPNVTSLIEKVSSDTTALKEEVRELKVLMWKILNRFERMEEALYKMEQRLSKK